MIGPAIVRLTYPEVEQPLKLAQKMNAVHFDTLV